MTDPDTTDPTGRDEDATREQQALQSERGIGVGTTQEPDTFEPEEPSD